MPTSAHPIYGNIADRWLLAILLCGIALSSYLLYQAQQTALSAIIQLDGAEYARLDFAKLPDKTQYMHIHGRLGESILAYNHQGIRMIASPCRQKRCIQHGLAQHAHDVLACVPNRIFVRLIGHQPPHALDAISQ